MDVMREFSDARVYYPNGPAKAAVKSGEYVFSVSRMEHGHIYGMTQALIDAGATLKYAWDANPDNLAAFLRRYPQAKAAKCEQEILDDPETRMVACAAIPCERSALGIRVMRAGKDYFTDKAPFTTLEQITDARAAVHETGRHYWVYFSERLHNEASTLAQAMIEQGQIGRVIHVEGLGPHKLGGPRPDWFYRKAQYGGILCDIGSHQTEQFMIWAGTENVRVTHSRIANYAHPETPELDDFGDCLLEGDNGVTGYFRVDWFTPNPLRVFGDSRIFILGTNGYIELKKTIDVTSEALYGNRLLLVNNHGEQRFDAHGVTGYPFFGKMLLDSLNGTDNAMAQEHIFRAAELCLIAQRDAIQVQQ